MAEYEAVVINWLVALFKILGPQGTIILTFTSLFGIVSLTVYLIIRSEKKSEPDSFQN